MNGPSRRPAPSRREILECAAALAALPLLGPAAAAEAPTTARHGLSTFGDLKYPPDFTHFDWVNPAAPKGGRLISVPSTWSTNQNPQTFNSFHDLILKSDAAVGLGLTHAGLMVRAPDEPDAVYGLVARSVERPDRDTLVFDLRPEARFSDGSALTAEDVAFSLTILREKGHPQISETLREVASVAVETPGRVVVRFSGKQGRGLAALVATQPILSKAWWSGRDFEQSSLEPILGAGPYRVGAFEAGRFVEYERLPDWWGRDLPVSRGQWNFDRVRFEMYRERTTAFEAFKAGQYLMREEFTSLVWATQYDFPAVTDGRVKRIELEDRSPSGAQGWFLNARRPPLKDPRVREALGLAFDFEWSNKNLFFGSYRRTSSFFVNSDLEATGAPSAEEMALLEPWRGRIPDEVFGEPWTAPVSNGSGQDRALLKRAADLLAAAGWKRGGFGNLNRSVEWSFRL
ncbi:MAG: extracellular solute-binding protein [Siculibacillus sp.]|nr:extracellular solute-binding protein [Siculibacillus sp.]